VILLDITAPENKVAIRRRGIPQICANGVPLVIDAVPCRFGGQRYFFRCPLCDRRTLRLHACELPPNVACRRCAIGRDYVESRNQSRGDRLCDKRAKLARKLGSQEPTGFNIPPRPAYMWRRRYLRLVEQIRRIDMDRMEVLYEAAIAMGLFPREPMIRADGRIFYPTAARRITRERSRS
jgi:hypothetical protein